MFFNNSKKIEFINDMINEDMTEVYKNLKYILEKIKSLNEAIGEIYKKFKEQEKINSLHSDQVEKLLDIVKEINAR